MRLAFASSLVLVVAGCTINTTTNNPPAANDTAAATEAPAECRAAFAGDWTITDARSSPRDGSPCDGIHDRYTSSLTIPDDASKWIETDTADGSVTTLTPTVERKGDTCTLVVSETIKRNGTIVEGSRLVFSQDGMSRISGITTVVAYPEGHREKACTVRVSTQLVR